MKPKRREWPATRRKLARRATVNANRVRRSLRRAAPLLHVIDELDLIGGLLGSVPQLNLAHQMVLNDQTSDKTLDPIKSWLAAFGGQTIDSHDRDDEHSAVREILGSPDAMIEVVRWRLVRLRALLEALMGQSTMARRPTRRDASQPRTLGKERPNHG